MTADHQHDHHHEIAKNADRKYLWAALIILASYMCVEIGVAIMSGSLALLADAGHMLSDTAAIAAALIAMRLAARPRTAALTFGWHRAEIITAALNGLTLLIVGVILGVEAVKRLFAPPEVDGLPVVITALVGVVVNIVCVWLVAKANRTNLNVEGAYQHILTDLYGFIGTAIAGVIILLTGHTIVDPIISLFVVLLMLRAGWSLVSQSVRIFAQAAPTTLDTQEISEHLCSREAVRSAHDIHVWTLTSGIAVLSAHVVVDDDKITPDDAETLRQEMSDCLKSHFGIEHVTVQLEAFSHVGDSECHCV